MPRGGPPPQRRKDDGTLSHPPPIIPVQKTLTAPTTKYIIDEPDDTSANTRKSKGYMISATTMISLDSMQNTSLKLPSRAGPPPTRQRDIEGSSPLPKTYTPEEWHLRSSTQGSQRTHQHEQSNGRTSNSFSSDSGYSTDGMKPKRLPSRAGPPPMAVKKSKVRTLPPPDLQMLGVPAPAESSNNSNVHGRNSSRNLRTRTSRIREEDDGKVWFQTSVGVVQMSEEDVLRVWLYTKGFE